MPDGDRQPGSLQVLGLAEGAVGYSRSGGHVDDVAETLDAYATQIVAGDIDVPTVLMA